MIPYDEAIAIILDSATTSTRSKKIPLLNALGKISAHNIKSHMQIPNFCNSAMDGFAVCTTQLENASAASPVTLSIVAMIAAGDNTLAVKPDTAVHVMTGAPISEPFNAVVPIELVTIHENTVTFTKPVALGDHIRYRGEDVQIGQLILAAGDKISTETIMLLAALGIGEIEVSDIPCIHIISTGNEITDDYTIPLSNTKIYNSTAQYLLAISKNLELEAIYKGIIQDNPASFEKIISSLPDRTIIISTGAVSKGALDFIPDSLHSIGATIHFHRVNIRPGKPILFATLPNGSLYFGLPGNPISTAIGFNFLVKPLIRKLQGAIPQEAPLMAQLSNDFIKRNDFLQFLKATASVDSAGQVNVFIADGQESFKISPMVKSNAWVVLNNSKELWKRGDIVPIHLYGSL